MILLKNIDQVGIDHHHRSSIHSSLLAKAKLESQLEVARTQEIANGGEINGIMKRVRILPFENSHQARFSPYFRIPFLVNYLN